MHRKTHAMKATCGGHAQHVQAMPGVPILQGTGATHTHLSKMACRETAGTPASDYNTLQHALVAYLNNKGNAI